ncbi:MAG: aldehyde dehydrogenase family protein, partial [Micrococcales bacterium]|nr:aldehyde dehydrogenase family protein [Micrococcales bacterium]
RALPRTRAEGTIFNGFSAEVWLPPGVTAAEARATAGLGSRTPAEGGGVGLVLGAGNITAIPVLDVLYELIAGNRVVILKLNPVMRDLAEVFARALHPLIGAGLLRIVQGGGEVGQYLAQHPSVDHVHITGSVTTHDAIVFGAGPEGERNRAERRPILNKPITSELGGVSPIIVVPGRWTRADLRFQAEHVATMRLHNGGFNCIAGQTVLLSSEWPQRDAFLRELQRALRTAPPRPSWYPGAEDRVADARRRHPDAEELGNSRVLVQAAEDASDVERTEYFAPVLGVIELPGEAGAFLDAAVDRVNDAFAGTLGANVIADPVTIRRLGRRFEGAVARLRYGAVTVNAWTGVAFLTAAAPWGAYPGNRLTDAGSGIGVVHNALLIGRPEKTVLHGPFRPFPRSVAHGEASLFPTPPWFVSARSAAETGRRLVEYETEPTPTRLAAIFGAAFRA